MHPAAQPPAAPLLLPPRTQLDDDDAPVCQGAEPAKVVIESVVPVTAEGLQTMQVVLRNVGLQTANMSGWLLTPGDGKAPDAKPHIFGTPDCKVRY